MKINRLFEIIYLLIEKESITAKELAEKFEVSTRTIYRDVEILSSVGIPIYMTKGRGGGISLLPNYILDKTVLTDKERENILSSLRAVQTVDIADSVIIDVAIKPLSTIPGIHSLSPRLYDEIVDGITNAFGQKNLPGINVKHRKGFIEINVYVRCLYGYNVIDIAKQLQSEIKQTLKNTLDLDHVKVDVHIEGIIKE